MTPLEQRVADLEKRNEEIASVLGLNKKGKSKRSQKAKAEKMQITQSILQSR